MDFPRVTARCEWFLDAPTSHRLAGKTLGANRHGTHWQGSGAACSGAGVRVIAIDPQPDQAFLEKHAVQLVSFDEALAVADIVQLTLACTSATTNIINRDTLGQYEARGHTDQYGSRWLGI